VSFKIIMTTSVTRPCFTIQHQTCKTKTDFFWSQTGLVLRPTVSDHITGFRTVHASHTIVVFPPTGSLTAVEREMSTLPALQLEYGSHYLILPTAANCVCTVMGGVYQRLVGLNVPPPTAGASVNFWGTTNNVNDAHCKQLLHLYTQL